MNFLLAFILFAALALTQGVPDATRPGRVVTAIVPGSPAEMAGLQLGDRIVAVDGQAVSTTTELQELTKARLGIPRLTRCCAAIPIPAPRRPSS